MMPPIRRLALASAFAFAFHSLQPAQAGALDEWRRIQAAPQQGYPCPRASGAIVIDGQLNDAAWSSAPWTAEFQDIEGAAKPHPSLPTRAKMLWDDRYFYIGARLTEPHVWGTITQRDAVIFHDNDFEVFIDPDGDGHQYYEFEMNALNTGWDLRLVKPYISGGPALNEWNIEGLQTAVHVEGTLNNPGDTDRSWSVEIAIPWKALQEFSPAPCPPRPGDRWAVNFSRVEWQTEIVDGKYRKVPNRREDNWVWSPTGIIDMHRPERWGVVEFTRAGQGRTKVSVGPVEKAREQMQAVFYAQRAHHERHGRFAANAADLDLARVPGAPKASDLRLDMVAGSYVASIPVQNIRGKSRAFIQPDGLFRIE